MFVLIFFAAFQATRDWGDIVTLLVVAVLGVYMKRFGWSRPAFMIGFVLSAQLENGLYRVAQVYGFSFLQRPAVLVLVVVLIISVIAALRFKAERNELTEDGVHASEGKTPQLVFLACALGFVALVLVQSFSWSFAAALLPQSAAVLTLILLTPLAITMVRSNSPSAVFYDTEREDFAEEVERRSNEYYFVWLLAYVAAAALAGFVIASVAFTFIFLRSKAHWSMGRALVGAGSLFVVLALLSRFLRITYPEGLIQDFIALPWPLS